MRNSSKFNNRKGHFLYDTQKSGFRRRVFCSAGQSGQTDDLAPASILSGRFERNREEEICIVLQYQSLDTDGASWNKETRLLFPVLPSEVVLAHRGYFYQRRFPKFIQLLFSLLSKCKLTRRLINKHSPCSSVLSLTSFTVLYLVCLLKSGFCWRNNEAVCKWSSVWSSFNHFNC